MDERKENLTREEVEKMQAQGTDVSELWQYVEANEEKELQFEAIQRARFMVKEGEHHKLLPNVTDLTKIQPHLNAMRAETNQFLVDTIGKKPRLFGKGSRQKKLDRAELLLTSVVQCHPDFWTKIDRKEMAKRDPEDQITPAFVVLLYSHNPLFSTDIEKATLVLKTISANLNDLRDMDELPKDAPKSVRKLYKKLNDPSSIFQIVLDDDILQFIGIEQSADDLQLIATTILMTSASFKLMPQAYLPSDGILPFIQTKDLGPKDSLTRGADYIPGKYYQA